MVMKSQAKTIPERYTRLSVSHICRTAVSLLLKVRFHVELIIQPSHHHTGFLSAIGLFNITSPVIMITFTLLFLQP